MGRVVRIVPDVSGIDKVFDYRVPDRWDALIDVGCLVRVELHGRRVAGWVVEVDVEPPPGLSLREILKVSSAGPSAEVVDLARWAAHRWHGRLSAVLRTASPGRMVSPATLPAASGAVTAPRPVTAAGPVSASGPLTTATATPGTADLVSAALGHAGTSVVRLPPATQEIDVLVPAADRGLVLAVMPGVGDARRVAGHLRRLGVRAASASDDWAGAARLRGPGVVIGARSAVWARLAATPDAGELSGDLSGIVVLDEHAEALQEERSPTWHARDVAIERATRLGVPCVLVSPAPTAIALERAGTVWTLDRASERAGWPIVDVVDRRLAAEEGRSVPGLFSAEFAAALRRTAGEDGRVLAVVNRKGRARLLACASCGSIVRTVDGRHAMAEVDGALVAPATGEQRPKICAVCDGTTLKRLQLGVTRAREELEALAGEPVGDVTADTPNDEILRHRILIGTEALLHRVNDAAVVCFLDFDQELLASRYRAAEQAMTLIVRAARIVGSRRPAAGGRAGRVLVQTRLAQHRVLDAAVHGDPDRYTDGEVEQRRLMGLPPFGALAQVGGAGAAEWLAPLTERLELADVSVLGPRDDRYLVRADTPDRLADVLAGLGRSTAVRVQVDPPRA